MTSERSVTVGGVTIGGGAPLALIGGPCAIEDERHALMMAERLQRVTSAARVPFIYKSSYDKANRFSVHSYRGPGLKEGLRILARVKETSGLPVLSDAHNVIDLLPEQRNITDKGGTMRLGLYPVMLAEGSGASRAYGQGVIQERHRHRYEVNNDYLPALEKNGLRISGIWAEKQLVEIIELPDHPFIRAALDHQAVSHRAKA
ncbi:MAG: hypothetical protein DMD77_10240 [Candidatus Rokuibacteriota bacterium]|nr:MAG: hypothetical protein DMD77_10240 [Candidatus Rokubacteria bacterium]